VEGPFGPSFAEAGHHGKPVVKGFTVGQLGHLVFAGFAKIRAAGRQKAFPVKITAAGRKAIATLSSACSKCHASSHGVMKSPNPARTQHAERRWSVSTMMPVAAQRTCGGR
jgi:hypothetical protein